jgi:WD40 repeat protein
LPFSPTSAALSPDGKRLAVGYVKEIAPCEAIVWDLETGKAVARFHGHVSSIVSIAFHPDGKRIATAERGHSPIKLVPEVKVWEADSGREVFTVSRFRGVLTDVAFSPDGKRLAASCDDGTVLIRDVRDSDGE